MNPYFTLTKNEQEIMHLLWTSEKPLSRADIIAQSVEASWKPSSIHILLNQLLDKGAIAVDGFVKTGKNYGRTFSPALTETEYHVMQFQNSHTYEQSQGDSCVDFLSAFLQEADIEDGTLNRLETLLKEKRKERG